MLEIWYNIGMPEEIQKITEKILPLLKQAGVLRSSLFGSIARGEAKPDSDIDILVELPRGKDLFDLIDLREKLSQALGKKVDIGTFNSVKPVLQDRIFKEQVKIYERQ